MESKKYFWIKLKTDFFNEDTIDWLLSQNNGCKYVVLYQMLCLKTANNDGYLNSKIGEMIVPYNINKIARDTKYFDVDTIRVALELFKKLGLVYEESDTGLRITNIDNMIGSESSSAKRVREYRERKALQCNTDVTNCALQSNIEIEIDKEIELDKDKDNKKKNARHQFGEYHHVLLTDDQYSKLKEEYPNHEELIKFLDEYIEMKGYKAKNHYLAIKKWVVDAVKERQRKQPLLIEVPKYEGTNNIEIDEKLMDKYFGKEKK